MSKLTHTCGYKLEFDNEFNASGQLFYVAVNMAVEFDGDVEPQSIEITECTIEDEAGNPMPFSIEEGRMERVVVDNYPDLTCAIENAVLAEIQTFAEDNCRFIGLDVAEDYEACYAEWHRE